MLETALVFAGIPAAVVACVTGLVFATSFGRGRRYRPGRPFEFAPVWFLSAPPDSAAAARAPAQRALRRSPAATAPAAELADSARSGMSAQWPVRDQTEQDAPGGASDRW